ncbi:MAG TPA: hypothetical protein VMB02_17265 [Candidatus Aquilonibacter sp.]|nr:hypothetical protein [Candidatus Aquilonibacter sp.]
MSDAPEMAQWIGQLADPDLAVRTAAAAQLYREGAALASSATNGWMNRREFRALVRSPEPVVGIAVEPQAFEAIRAANGSPRLADVPPDQDAKEFELPLAGAHFDILTTREPEGDGAIARYLRKFGAGIQQIEIAVSHVGRATAILRAGFGLEPVYPATRPGADATRVNFFLVPAQGKKVLVELVEAG